MRALFAVPFAAALVLAACGPNKPNGHGGPDAKGTGIDGSPDACVGLQCMQVSCTGQGIGTTRLSGYVYAPNGTLPLFNATVYVPNSDPGPLPTQVTCDRCNDILPGNPVVSTTTDETGYFQLDNVPVAPNLPVIIQMGKWRRQIKVATVNMCADNPLDATQTRLPRNHTEGDIPHIAISTGGCDALECLARKIGIDDSEFTNSSGSGRVHLFNGTGGTSSFASGSALASSTTWWSSLDNLKPYDIVMFACECDQHMETKSATALQALYDYANLGGRVFLSHWQNGWVENAPQPWPMVANFDNNQDVPDTATDSINQGFDRGKSMFKWLGGPKVKALDANNLLDVTDPRDTALSINNDPSTGKPRADDYVDLGGCVGGCSHTTAVQDFQFTVPNDKPDTERCGKVVFSDMHVSGSTTSAAFPGECTGTDLSPQEKALAFIFFDIASCVGPIVN